MSSYQVDFAFADNEFILNSTKDTITRLSAQDVLSALSVASGPDRWGFFEDFRGRVSTNVLAPFTLTLGGSGTFATPAAQVAGGVAAIVTGATDNNHNDIAYDLVHTVSGGWAFFEARIASITAITTRAIEVGFSDALSETNGLAFTSSDSTPVAVADNAAIFQYNTDDTPGDIWVAASVNAGGTPQATALTAAPVADTYQTLRVEVSPEGDAYFYVAGSLVATLTDAVATTAVLTPWVAVKTLAGSAVTVNVDYLWGYGASGLNR